MFSKDGAIRSNMKYHKKINISCCKTLSLGIRFKEYVIFHRMAVSVFSCDNCLKAIVQSTTIFQHMNLRNFGCDLSYKERIRLNILVDYTK